MTAPRILRALALLAAALAVITMTGCGGSAHQVSVTPAAHASTPAPVPALSRTQGREACAGIHVGFLARRPAAAYADEVKIAWEELKTATGRQADQAVINAAALYCPHYALSPLPSYDLP
jgi:hypothetical protein